MNNFTGMRNMKTLISFLKISGDFYEAYNNNKPLLVKSHNNYYRGYGKTELINDIALIAMSEGKKVLILATHPTVEYFTDKVIYASDVTNIEDSFGFNRNKFNDYAILCDEVLESKFILLSAVFDMSRVIGFVFDDRKEKTNENPKTINI